jgi:hypothetical protein
VNGELAAMPIALRHERGDHGIDPRIAARRSYVLVRSLSTISTRTTAVTNMRMGCTPP